jgi:hypothetical protein
VKHLIPVSVDMATGRLRLGPEGKRHLLLKCACPKLWAIWSRCKRCRAGDGPCANHGGDGMPLEAVRVLVMADGRCLPLNVEQAMADRGPTGGGWMNG